MNEFLQTVNRFEANVFQSNRSQAMVDLGALLNMFMNPGFDLKASGNSDDSEYAIYTRVAAAVSHLFLASSSVIDQPNFERLCNLHGTLTNLFTASGFGSTAHLLNLMMQSRSDSKGISLDELRKMLPFVGSENAAGFVLQLLPQMPNAIRLPWVLALLGSANISSANELAAYQQVLQLAKQLGDARLTEYCLLPLENAYMKCSYAPFEGKHEVKVALNQIIEKYFVDAEVVVPAPVRQIGKQRPRILVIVENFTTGHAMYRCYMPSIRQLTSRFELILLHPPKKVDDSSKALFDQCLESELDFHKPQKLVNTVTDLRPDMIYYPSLGMDPMAVLLSNLRLAPVQLFSGGHPASSRSRHIDYALFEEQTFGAAACYSETVLLSLQGPKHTAGIDTSQLAPMLRAKPNIVKVAIPANQLKLNFQFLDCCRQIAEKSVRDVEFHFFPNKLGLQHAACRKRIERVVGNCVVYKKSDYKTYLDNLNHCDLCFSSFPFGIANGFVDVALLGLPVLSLDGAESHSHIESGFNRRLGMPDYLSATCIDDYIVTALRLIENDEERLRLSRTIVEQDIRKQFFAEFRESPPTDFVDLLSWVYDNHEAIQADARKLWNQQARLESAFLVTQTTK